MFYSASLMYYSAFTQDTSGKIPYTVVFPFFLGISFRGLAENETTFFIVFDIMIMMSLLLYMASVVNRISWLMVSTKTTEIGIQRIKMNSQ